MIAGFSDGRKLKAQKFLGVIIKKGSRMSAKLTDDSRAPRDCR